MPPLGLLVAAIGRIGSAGSVDVEEPGVRSVARDVTIAVGVIGGGATPGELFAPRRLCELPDGGIGDAAGRGRRRIWRHGATGRGRTRVVENPILESMPFQMVANVVRCDDGDGTAFVHGHTGAIHASAVA